MQQAKSKRTKKIDDFFSYLNRSLNLATIEILEKSFLFSVRPFPIVFDKETIPSWDLFWRSSNFHNQFRDDRFPIETFSFRRSFQFSSCLLTIFLAEFLLLIVRFVSSTGRSEKKKILGWVFTFFTIENQKEYRIVLKSWVVWINSFVDFIVIRVTPNRNSNIFLFAQWTFLFTVYYRFVCEIDAVILFYMLWWETDPLWFRNQWSIPVTRIYWNWSVDDLDSLIEIPLSW